MHLILDLRRATQKASSSFTRRPTIQAFQDILQDTESDFLQVGKPAHGVAHGPLSVVVGELFVESPNGSKPSLAIVVRNVSMGLSESDNIRTAISRQVHDESRVLADFPSLLDAEMIEGEVGFHERIVPVAARNPHSCLAKSDEIPLFVTGQVGDATWMFVEIPSLIDSKLAEDDLDRAKAAVSFVQRNMQSFVATADDVNLPITPRSSVLTSVGFRP